MDKAEIQKMIDTSIAANNKVNDLKFNGLESAIEGVNKKTEADAKPVAKKEVPKPIEIKEGSKTFRAKTNKFRAKDKSGAFNFINLIGLDDKARKEALAEWPSAFVEV